MYELLKFPNSWPKNQGAAYIRANIGSEEGRLRWMGQSELKKMEPVCFPETLVSAYESVRHQNPEHLRSRHRDNFKSHVALWGLGSPGMEQDKVEIRL
jgi:hypothetical protein